MSTPELQQRLENAVDELYSGDATAAVAQLALAVETATAIDTEALVDAVERRTAVREAANKALATHVALAQDPDLQYIADHRVAEMVRNGMNPPDAVRIACDEVAAKFCGQAQERSQRETRHTTSPNHRLGGGEVQEEDYGAVIRGLRGQRPGHAT